MQPKRYRALHITPGVVDYPEENPPETVLIKKQALDKMNPSFLGKPVFNFVHKPHIDPSKAFEFTNEEIEEHADGVISNVGYDVETGYFFVDMMIWDEGTQDNLDNGYGVSNAYIPERDNSGGDYNSVPYNVEVVDGEYHHMAVVEDPRYGDVRIFENSKKGKPMKWKISWPKKKEEPIKKNMAPEKGKEKEKEEMELNADSVLVGEDGEEYPLSEMVEAYKKSMAPADDGKPTVNMEDTMDIDGKEVSMKELYDNFNANKNAEPPTDEALDDVVDPALKKNSAGNDGEKKKPNENFMTLKTNANKGAEPEKIKVNTEKTRLKRGQSRYGSAVKVVGGN